MVQTTSLRSTNMPGRIKGDKFLDSDTYYKDHTAEERNDIKKSRLQALKRRKNRGYKKRARPNR